MIPEDALRRAAREADRALADSLPDPADCAHTFSPKFERDMSKVFCRWRHRKTYKILRNAACFMLVIFLVGAIFLSTNAQARVAFSGWIREYIDGMYHYSHRGSPTPNPYMRQYSIKAPEGYQLEETIWSGDYGSEYYVKEGGTYIYFYYSYQTETCCPRFSVKDGQEKKEVEVSGNIADLYLSHDSETPNQILWWDEETDAFLGISAFMEEKSLLALAESVFFVEKGIY